MWKNVLANMSDFKELVPEFYDPNNKGDFLINSYGIDFGYRHDGVKVGDVHLPPWADSKYIPIFIFFFDFDNFEIINNSLYRNFFPFRSQ